MGVSGGKWANLPIEILDEMLTRSADIEDFIRFGGVCRSWRSASVESNMTNNNFGPWLMLSEPEHPHNFLEETTVMLINMFHQEEDEESNSKIVSDDNHVLRRFFNLSTKKTLELYLPEAQGRRCWGSNYGWLFTIGLDLKIHLLNPLTREQITLPPQHTFQKQYSFYVEPEGLRTIFVDKFAMSSHPNGNTKCHPEKEKESLVVMVIYSQGRTLAMCRLGDRAWTDVKCPKGIYEDIICYNNVFYAVHNWGDVYVCDITTPQPVATVFMPPPLRLPYSYRYYLVEFSGDLHVVVRMYYEAETLETYEVTTTDFKVYKLDFCQKQWIQLEDLGDHALFLGNNASFAISTINHPHLLSNSIYFSNDYSDFYVCGYCDLGLFDFGKKKVVDPVYSGDRVCSTYCTPLFFLPNLQ